MRKLLIFSISILMFASCSTSTSKAQEEGYKIKVKIDGIGNDTIYLANYFGKKLYYADTTVASNNVAIFEGDSLSGGKFAIVMLKPEIKYFELIVAEPYVELETSTENFLDNMKIIKSKENTVYYDYVRFLKERKEEMTPWEEKLKDFKGTPDEREAIIDQLKAINEKVTEEQKRIIRDYPDLLVAEYIKMGMQIQVPDPPRDENGNITDSLFQRRYYVNHYFDNINFKDDRSSHDPVFYNKINDFFTKVCYPTADSINYYGDRLIGETNYPGDNFKFIVHYLTTLYDQTKRMGLDAVFVHMAEKYYMTDKAYWLDSAATAKIVEKAIKLKPILIGEKAPFLNLFDTTGTKRISLYGVQADYIILYFWSDQCGHCQKATPKLLEVYHKYKDKGVEVYAVGTELENDGWKDFIRKYKLDFINVSDTPEKPDYFRTHYDIFATPKVFILDKDKTIIAKDIGVEQIGNFLDFEMNKKK